MPKAIHIKIAEPAIAITIKTEVLFKKGAKPKIIETTRASSRIPWPNITNGPTLNPLFVLSLIVTVNNGPGITAPENAIKNEEKNIELNVIMKNSHTKLKIIACEAFFNFCMEVHIQYTNLEHQELTIFSILAKNKS